MGAVYISLCERCAGKIGKRYAIAESSTDFFGTCPQCFTPSKLVKYDIGPSHAELERRRRQSQSTQRRSGGGERARAGRRAR